MAGDEHQLPDTFRERARDRTVEDYVKLDRLLASCYEISESVWTGMMRWLVAHDLFFFATRVATTAWAKDQSSGLPIFNRPFILDRCRDIEEREHMVLDFWGRGMGKSTLKTKLRNIQRAINDPNSAGYIFSYDKEAALAHLGSISEELQTNQLLTVKLFPDVFFQYPLREAPSWGLNRRGLIVKRKSARIEPTFGAFGLKLRGLPTGHHPDRHDVDDAEDKSRVQSPEAIQELKDAASESGNLKSKGRFVRTFTGTAHSPTGYVMYLVGEAEKKDSPIEVRYHPGESLATPGPGPLGGVSTGYYSTEELWRWYGELGKESYAEQVALDLTVAQVDRFETRRIVSSSQRPEEAGKEAFAWICIDPAGAEGTGDRVGIFMWGLLVDRRKTWLDAAWRRMTPQEMFEETSRMIAKWEPICPLIQGVRIECYGPVDYHSQLERYLESQGQFVPVQKCNDNRGAYRGKSKWEGKVKRAWARWQPPIRRNEIVFPERLPIWTEDGKEVNVAAYFRQSVLAKFPRPLDFALLDAGGLLWEDPERKVPNGDGETYGELEYPDVELLRALRVDPEDEAEPVTGWQAAGPY